LGRTIRARVEPGLFYEPCEIAKDVRDKVERAKRAEERIDYLTFVPDGEPTLDINLGRAIRELEILGIKTAVISNASLLWRKPVRERLLEADWVSVKVDSVRPDTWRRINRPHGSLDLRRILSGIAAFAESFGGDLVTETMLVEGLNDSESDAHQVAEFLATLQPKTAYVSIPTRPPAEMWAQGPTERPLNRFYQVLSDRIENVEYLIGYEGNAFAFTGDVEEDLLSIAAVHPMREEAVESFLDRAGAGWSVVERLLREGKLNATRYRGNTYFVRRLPRKRARSSTRAGRAAAKD
jgi:wyosine [tRNA(Phe)-imidazoG37] synthetase (radical SAM superfamily)